MTNFKGFGTHKFDLGHNTRDTVFGLVEKVEKAGFKVIYGDTDSISFSLEKKSKKTFDKVLTYHCLICII